MKLMIIATIFFCVFPLYAKDYHVSVKGDDSGDGSRISPFKTIQQAADRAQPGDVITVHEGVYRERITPPRGGISEDRRIIYRVAKGEDVFVKGSEIVKGWEKVKNDTWKVVLSNGFFGEFNPFKDLISGDWFMPQGRSHHTGAVYLNGRWLPETFTLDDVLKPAEEIPVWFAQVDNTKTTIWAQFKGFEPDKDKVEINVRQSVFYPEKTGINYITVRGFTMEHAATPWAPPTAEQIGLIGTNWSKGWVIENNTVRHSVCSGIALGKHGDAFDNTSKNSAEGYVETIKRAFEQGWSKGNIGHHVVRNNHISDCGQAGIVGSMGALFSSVTGNVIHDIHQGRSFGGVEMAGIKFHGAIDTVIRSNHIYRCGGAGGIWLDWMAQGARVTGNLLHDNTEDLFMEVNHGPFLIDNNIFLSEKIGVRDWSQGGAYVHNLIAGPINWRKEERQTPYFKPHSTEEMRLSDIQHQDLRFYNNIFLGSSGLERFDEKTPNILATGNLYLDGTKPSVYDKNSFVASEFKSQIKLEENADGWWLEMAVDQGWTDAVERDVVTTELLGEAAIPDAPFERPDGKPYKLDKDYFGNKRPTKPVPGPFNFGDDKMIRLKVW